VPLTLQLLVENALKHNVATVKEPLVITIAAGRHALLVTNPTRPKMTPPRSTGFGLESIVKRYGAITEHPIVVSSTEGVFRVQIPLLGPEP
jgi:LytS/YehU family sensor histidine kinase